MTWDGDERRQDPSVQHTLGRIEAKLDSVDEKVEDTRKYARENSKRIRSLEVSRGWFVGAGAGAGAVAAWLLDFFGLGG
jgi:hypothetical protein